jgi:hypothetical protein
MLHGLTFDLATSLFQSVDDPNGIGTTTSNGVNDNGQIVGFYVDGNGNTDGLLASTPEPGTLAMGGLSLFAVGLYRTRRRRSVL